MGIVSLLSGCGTSVPEIQENPWSQEGGQMLVNAIVNSIQCEIQNAITFVINEDFPNI
jgi:hypothetical protein